MFKNYLKIIWASFTNYKTDKSKLQNHARQQEKFKKRYPNYTVGTASYGMPIVHDNNEGSTLKIGAYCSIASNVQIFLGGQHRMDWVSNYPFPFFFEMDAQYKKGYIKGASRGDVVVGSDVWLCANCIILSGVTIGHGAVIANGAVVSRDVEPYAVMAGNPAKLIKWRFDEATRNVLMAVAWWDWPQEEISKVMDKLCTQDASDLLAYAKART